MTTPGWPGGPAQPPPPFSPLAPPAPRRNRTLPVVLTVVGVVVALCCAGGVIGGIFLYRGVAKATGPARDAADSFISDLQSGDTAGAYDLLCDHTRGAFTEDAFARGVSSQPKIVSHRFAGVNVTSGSRGTTAVVRMKLTLQTGFVDQHTIPMVKEGGRWKVCGGPY